MVTKERELFDISDLIVKSLLDELSDDERLRLEGWLAESDPHRRLFTEICSEINLSEQRRVYVDSSSEKAFLRFMMVKKQREDKKFRRRFSVFKYAALFALPLLLAGVVWWFYHSGEEVVMPPSYAETLEQFSSYQPVLTLEDGREMVVDKDNSALNALKGITVSGKQEAALIYSGDPTQTVDLVYHVLSTPAQCDYHFTLSDGTKVWMNAQSTLKYPVAFGPGERTVYASGEIYLEVAQDSLRPFYVVTDDLKVKVLGTAFNVSAYQDEDFVTVTLVRGKVAAYVNDAIYQLLPSKQLYFDLPNKEVQLHAVNVNDYIAWKNGQYVFKGQTLSKVAKVLQRWYDVEIIFESQSSREVIFTGVINKEEPLSEFVERLFLSSSLDCRMEENRLYIK